MTQSQERAGTPIEDRQRAVAAGAEVIYPLEDQFYGERGGRPGSSRKRRPEPGPACPGGAG